MTSENTASDMVLWLGEKHAPPLRALIAAQFRIVDQAPQAGERFGIIADRDAAAAGLRLALDRPDDAAALILLGPILIGADGRVADEALLQRLASLKIPLLTVFGTKDISAPPEAGRYYRGRLPSCNVVFVYEAGAAMAAERPEAIAELAIDFLRRGDTFIVRQTSDLLYP